MLTLTYLPPGGWYNNNTIYVTRPRAGRCDGAGHRCLCDAAAAIVQPSWCDVPAGALNHTGVISKRNESALQADGSPASVRAPALPPWRHRG